MALTAEQIQNQLEAYLDTDEGKNLLAPMGMQAGGRLVGFAGPDRLTNNEEDKEEEESVFTSEEGSSFLTDLTEGLVESGVLQYGVNLGGASAVSAASQIPGIAGAVNLFGSATESAVNFISNLGTSTVDDLLTTSGTAAAGAEASALPFGFNPITAAYFLYNVIPAIGKQISGQTDNLRKELSRLAAYKPGTGSFGKQQKGAIEFNTQLRDFAVKLIEAGWDPDRGFIQQAQEGDPKLLGSFYEIVSDFPAVVGYFGDRFGEEIFNNPTEETAESGEVIDSAQEKYEETELEEGLQENTEAAEEELQDELDNINAETSEDITNEDVKEAVEGLEEATTNTQTAEEAVKVSTQSYSDYLAGVGMEDLDRTIAANEAQLRRIPRLQRKTGRGRAIQKRIDKAKIEKRNRLTKAKQIADTAKVDLENAKKAEALARKEAEDARKSASAEARRKFETKQKELIADKQKAADAAAAERKARAEERAEERADYTKVEGTPDTDTTAPEADPIEIKDQVTKPPVNEEIDPDVQEPVVEEPKETETVETTETADEGGGGGGGAGEGSGVDAEAGTTTAATTATETTTTEAAQTGLEEAGETDGNAEGAGTVLGQLKEAIDAETDPKLKAKLEEEYKKYEGALQEGGFTKETIEDIVGPAGMPFDFVGNTVDIDPVNILSWIGKVKDVLEDKEDALPTEGGVTETETTTDTKTAGTTDTTDTTTATTTAGTDTTTTADTSTGTAGATTTPTETTTGGAGTDEGLGTGDADVTGTGTDVSDTPGAGAGDEGDPGDVGEGTGTGAGTGTGTGGGTGSGEGTGTGSGTGEGTGEGTGRGFDFGSQQLLQALQPRQVQVKSAPLADIKRIYDISGRYIPIEEYRSPFGLPSLGRPPQQTRPMGFKQGGLVSQNTDNMFDHKEVGTVNDLLRILRDKR